MKQIRLGVFETNSSSTHSLTICGKAEFEAWKMGEKYLDAYKDKLVDKSELTEDKMEDEDYQSFETWNYDYCLETFIKYYTTESGDEIVAFGKYGENR